MDILFQQQYIWLILSKHFVSSYELQHFHVVELFLKYSIQNIFMQVGQFDRYTIFDFCYGSAAYLKYGGMVYGYIIYTPSERAKLKVELQSENIGNDDGLIILDGALQDKEKNRLLSTEGFYARDIVRLSTIDIGPINNQYDNSDTKDIPNTIELKINSSKFDGVRLDICMFQKRMEEGVLLIPEEIRRYYSLIFLLEPLEITEEIKQKIFTNPATGQYYDDVWITALKPLVYANQIEKPIRMVFNRALANRRKERIAYICRHLGIASKHLDRLKIDNPNAFKELMSLVYGFEPETLTIWGWSHHVYWDFERFIHIYLRHYKNFLINESSKGQGTGFQYTIKDIRRIINLVLDANKVAIETRLEAGKSFHLQNDNGYYFNGNYYSLKIDPDGRLMQFHPQDNIYSA